jgi:hypothetical protein
MYEITSADPFGKNSSLWSFDKKMKKIVLFNLQQKLPGLGPDMHPAPRVEKL